MLFIRFPFAGWSTTVRVRARMCVCLAQKMASYLALVHGQQMRHSAVGQLLIPGRLFFQFLVTLFLPCFCCSSLLLPLLLVFLAVLCHLKATDLLSQLIILRVSYQYLQLIYLMKTVRRP